MKKGDLVLCEFEYNDLVRYKLQQEGVALPEAGKIYTVSKVIDVCGLELITLEEIPNPMVNGSDFEMHFPAKFFHQLDIPDLEIDLDHKITNPKPYKFL